MREFCGLAFVNDGDRGTVSIYLHSYIDQCKPTANIR